MQQVSTVSSPPAALWTSHTHVLWTPCPPTHLPKTVRLQLSRAASVSSHRIKIAHLHSQESSLHPHSGVWAPDFAFFFFFNKSPLKFIYWPCWVFVAGPRLSPAAVSRASAPWCSGFSPWRPAPLHRMAFRSCGSGAPGGQAQAWWHTDLVAPQHVRSSRAGGCTGVPCIARQL